MDKLIFSYQDRQLTLTEAGRCTLYLTIGTESLTLMVLNENQQCLALQGWHFATATAIFSDAEPALRRILGQEPIFSMPFRTVRYAFAHAQLTLVPNRLFRKEDMASYFKLLLPEGDYVYRAETIPEFDCYQVYALEASALRICHRYFPNGAELHIAGSLIRQFSKISSGSDHAIFANFRHQMVQICVLERNNLRYYNSFFFQHPNDLLYAVLLVYDQFRLSPLDVPLQIAGNLLEDSEVYRLLRRFIQKIEMVSLPNNFNLGAASSNLPPHCFFDLICLKNN
jgi:hypothetical protein